MECICPADSIIFGDYNPNERNSSEKKGYQ